jgi:uncharacterized protein (DUF924 family)
VTDEVDSVHAFWFGRSDVERKLKSKLWFGGGPDIDADIRRTFGALVDRARAGELDSWSAEPKSSIAWLILVDQFSRNLFRNSPLAFSCDPKALQWARDGFARGTFDTLSSVEKMFATLPFEHAEDLEAQKEGVARAIRIALSDPAAFEQLAGFIEWGRKHLDVIARFGRFPHRNTVLGRESTQDELDYLAFGKQAKQWL